MTEKYAGKIISARRTVNIPWTESLQLGLTELTTGRSVEANKQFTKSSWAYSCMSLRGSELANLPWRLVRKNGNEVKNHMLYDLLTNFGNESGWADAILSTEVDLCMYGAAYWLRDVDILKRLNPSTIEVKRTVNGITGFKQTLYGPSGEETVNNFSRDEIIYFREYHPDDDLGPGIPIMQILKSSIDTEFEAERMVKSHFQNDAIPGLLLTTEQTVPEDEANRILRWWNRRFQGSSNKGKVGIADRGLKAEILAESIRENAVIELLDSAHKDICVGFQVPSILIGDMLDSTYANAQEARKFMIEDLILPRARNRFASVINKDLVHKIDKNITFEFAEDELPILQEDTSAKWSRLKEALELGIVTRDYVANEMGLELAELSEEQLRVVKSWKRKAMKAFDRGESPNVDFETDELSKERQYAIRASLDKATTEKEIEDAFYERG